MNWLAIIGVVAFGGGTVVRSADQHNASSPLLEPAPRGRARLVLDRRSDPYIRSHSFVRSLHRLAALNYLLPFKSGHSASAQSAIQRLEVLAPLQSFVQSSDFPCSEGSEHDGAADYCWRAAFFLLRPVGLESP